MSLINKMLQDLDKRGATPQRVEGTIREVEPVKREESRLGPIKVFVGATLVVGMAAIAWFTLSRGSRPDERVAVAPSQAPAPPSRVESVPPAPKPESAAPVEPAVSSPPERPEPVPAMVPATHAAMPAAEPPSIPPPEPVPTKVDSTPAKLEMAPAKAEAPPAKPVPAPAKVEKAEPAPPVKAAVPPPSAVEKPVPERAVAKIPEVPPQVAKVESPKPAAKPEVAVRRPEPAAPESIKSAPPRTEIARAQRDEAPKASVSAPAPATLARREVTVPPVAPSQGSLPDAATESAKGTISIERQVRQTSPQERAAAEYRTAVEVMNQGRVDQAIALFASAVSLDPRHFAARQAIVALLVERGRTGEAQGVLREGLQAFPENTAWAMLLARLQVEEGDTNGALDTLAKALPQAKGRPDYHAFYGTVLQMQSRHREAIVHYEIAANLSPGNGSWLAGLAISLEEERRVPEAREAYQRALATSTLSPRVRTFAEGKLSQLSRQ